MNLGIAISDDRLRLVRYYGADKPPEFGEYIFNKQPGPDPPAGYLWDIVDVAAGDSYLNAQRLILSVPAPLCYLKRLEIENNMILDHPHYLEWLAGLYLPGNPAKYKYEFIPIGQSFDGAMLEMILAAIPLEPLSCLIHSLKIDDDFRDIIAVPEQLGLTKVLERSLSKDDIPQAGIINFSIHGASVVLIKNDKFSHDRYFPTPAHAPDDLSVEIETYLLSRTDPSDPLPLVVTGQPDLFTTNMTSLHPPFLAPGDFKFADVLGAVEYDFSNGAK